MERKFTISVGGNMGRMKDLAIDELNRLADESSQSSSEYLEDEESWFVEDDYLFTEEDD